MDGGTQKTHVRFPPKLEILFKPARYKVLWGGRDAGRSWGAARALLVIGAAKQHRILCAREIQRTLADSVHKLLCDQIENMNLGGFYSITDNAITGANGTEFLFTGLRDQDANKIKSYEGVTICWVEEAEAVTKRSWNILEPTIRRPGSEIWVTFNPQLDTDETYQRFVVAPPPDAVVVHMTWRDNPWASLALIAGREHMQRTDPDSYANIWDGKCRTVVAGAIYAKEVMAMIEGRRATRAPYDPQLPVHTVWDLGWNDAMAIILVQRYSSAVMIIGYLEASGKTYADCAAELNRKPYVWGTDWLPHDGAQHRPDTGKSPQKILRDLRRNEVRVMPQLDVEAGIGATRMLFPRLYIDNSVMENAAWEHDGGARLIECLKRYRRAIPVSTGEPARPVHDEYSHGADAVRGLATIVERMRNERDVVPQLKPIRPLDVGLGM